MDLIIAEKPSQAEKIAAPFGGTKQKDCIQIKPCSTFPNGAIVVWCVGNICELAEPQDYDDKYKTWRLEDLPIIPNPFKLNVVSEKRKVFNTIKRYVNHPQVGMLIHSGDAGPQGQLLVDEVISLTNKLNKPVKRLWVTSLTPNAVKKAFAQIKDNKHYRNLHVQALSRSHADWLIGINGSRCFSVLFSSIQGKEKEVNETFSIGRVQTALTSIIYDREKDIENFNPEKYWDLRANFTINNHTYTGKWFKENDTHIFHEQIANELVQALNGKETYIYSSEKKEKSVRPPLLHNLSSLQAAANKRFKYSPKQTLDVAQSLYEKGYISYPRTASTAVTEEEAKGFPDILKGLANNPLYKHLIPTPIDNLLHDPRYTNVKKVDDHYALIPTEQIPNIGNMSQTESNVYDLIARTLISAHYPDAKYIHHEIITVVNDKFTFISKATRLTERGWKAVFPSQNEEKSNEETCGELPDLQEGARGLVASIEVVEGNTQPKPRFTQGNLITAMKNAAIYTDDKEGMKNKEFSLGTEATRAGIIEQIINKKYIEIKKNQVFLTSKGRLLIEALKHSNGILTSPLLTARWENYLNQIGEGKKEASIFIQKAKEMTKKIVSEMVKSSETWKFDDYLLDMKKEKFIGSCKKCGSPVVERKGFYGCSSFKTIGCDFIFNKTYCGKKIPLKEIRSFFEKGTTSLIKGFQSKNGGETFDSYIIWSDEKKRPVFAKKKPKVGG